jgi:hypothetical protein
MLMSSLRRWLRPGEPLARRNIPLALLCRCRPAGKVYDVTAFLEEHPGGYDVILTSSGGREGVRGLRSAARPGGVVPSALKARRPRAPRRQGRHAGLRGDRSQQQRPGNAEQVLHRRLRGACRGRCLRRRRCCSLLAAVVAPRGGPRAGAAGYRSMPWRQQQRQGHRCRRRSSGWRQRRRGFAAGDVQPPCSDGGLQPAALQRQQGDADCRAAAGQC